MQIKVRAFSLDARIRKYCDRKIETTRCTAEKANLILASPCVRKTLGLFALNCNQSQSLYTYRAGIPDFVVIIYAQRC